MEDAWLSIFGYCGVNDLLRWECACQRWRALIGQSGVWRAVVHGLFPRGCVPNLLEGESWRAYAELVHSWSCVRRWASQYPFVLEPTEIFVDRKPSLRVGSGLVHLRTVPWHRQRGPTTMEGDSVSLMVSSLRQFTSFGALTLHREIGAQPCKEGRRVY